MRQEGQRSPVKFASLHIFNIFNGAGKGRDRGRRQEGQRSEIRSQSSEGRNRRTRDDRCAWMRDELEVRSRRVAPSAAVGLRLEVGGKGWDRGRRQEGQRSDIRGQRSDRKEQWAEDRNRKDEGQTALAAVERSDAQGAIVKLFFFGNL